MGIIVTIDGPAGAGKSTVARELAQKLGFNYINTGDLYRYVTYCAIKEKKNVYSSQEMNELTLQILEKYSCENSDNSINFISQLNLISDKIHSPEVDKKVSYVAEHASVRKNLVPLQRFLAKNDSVVIEGRDIGTVIIPHADFKFFITADKHTRIMRRYRELQDKGYQITFAEVKREIASRDNIDSKRKAAPLTQPEDAILIDTSNKTIDEVIVEILYYVKGA